MTRASITARHLLITVLVAHTFIAGCSSMRSKQMSSSVSDIEANAPYTVVTSAGDVLVARVLQQAAAEQFGQYVQIVTRTPGRGRIEVLFTTTTAWSGFSTWQNSTSLVTVYSEQNEVLWTGEYNYKGGYEMSGFSVNTPAEAAHLVMERLATQFAEDYKLKRAGK